MAVKVRLPTPLRRSWAIGKMIKTLILGVVIASSSALGATRGPDITVNVTGCASLGTNAAAQTRSPENTVGRHLEVKPGTILYSGSEGHACCLRVDVQKQITGQKITLTQAWSGMPCRCLCTSLIQATISNLPPGQYQIELYRIDDSAYSTMKDPKLVFQETTNVP